MLRLGEVLRSGMQDAVKRVMIDLKRNSLTVLALVGTMWCKAAAGTAVVMLPPDERGITDYH